MDSDAHGICDWWKWNHTVGQHGEKYFTRKQQMWTVCSDKLQLLLFFVSLHGEFAAFGWVQISIYW